MNMCMCMHNQPMNVYLFQPLDAASLGELKVALNGFLQKGETIKLETKVQCQPVTPKTYRFLQLAWQVKVIKTSLTLNSNVIYLRVMCNFICCLLFSLILQSWVAWSSVSATSMWTCPPKQRFRSWPSSSRKLKSRGLNLAKDLRRPSRGNADKCILLPVLALQLLHKSSTCA